MKNVLILTGLIVGVVHAQVPTDRAWTILTDGAADKSAEKREKAYHALGLLNGNAKARGLAEAGLADPNPSVRAAAADALGRMGATASIPKLKEVITNDKEAEAVFAANALYLLKDKTAYDVYYAVLTGERKSGQGLVESQMKMLKDPKALAQMGFEAGIGFVPFAGAGLHVLKMVTKDDVSPIRAAAALKLAGDPDPKSGEALAAAASDKKTLVRAAAVDASTRGDPKLLSAIFPLLDDSEDVVKFDAAATVLKLSGHGKAAPHK